MYYRIEWRRWRDTDYEVSDTGKVRRSDDHRHKMRTVTNNSGYTLAHLSVDGRSVMVPVHRMVAECFVDNPLGKPVIDHIDRDKSNNRACNLRWVSSKENSANRDMNFQRRPVRMYCDAGLLDIFPTCAAASRAVGVTCYGVKACCEGWQATCKGYRFRYDDGMPESICLF